MDNRKKKQTLSRTGLRTGTRSPRAHAERPAAKKRSPRQPGRSAHISQNRNASPMTPDSLRTAVPRSAEPYKPSFSYAETLVTDAELEAFLSRAVQDIIPDPASGGRSASDGRSALSRDTQAGNREKKLSSPSAGVQSAKAGTPDIPDPLHDAAGSARGKAPAASSGEQTGKIGLSPQVRIHQAEDPGLRMPAEPDPPVSVETDFSLQGQKKVSAAGKTARNRALSEIVDSLSETGSGGPSAGNRPHSADSRPTYEDSFPPFADSLPPFEDRPPLSTGGSAPQNTTAESQKMPGEKPGSVLTVKKVCSALLTLAGAAACILIVRYFHMRSVGITPEIGVFSTLAGQALKSENTEQEDPDSGSGAQDAPPEEDQSSGIADPSASDGQDETKAGSEDQDASADSPAQPLPAGEEATDFDPASDPASLFPASQDPVAPAPASPDPAYSDPAYSDPVYSDPASQDPAYYDPAYLNQEADPAESDWDFYEEEPEWNTIEEDDPYWDEEENMEDEDADYEDEDEDYED